ncbi:hypothetical protein [Niveibacterium microcysteis]|uniref:Uncharacterized protein n=1 Tax=Niveibacterium microcysteis TaxID=2811415 RepID=A0ABX7M9Y4_9RHOO|nr:hypothetical protein [Niveibacterium microcysteis]QSI78194.1 hypothetical protein JY500_06035 [Niveibacterium microcysteis]
MEADAYLTVAVRSNGFAGHNDLWVAGPSLRSFCSRLVELERTLRGEATLKSISPNELKLVVSSVTSRGNIAVHGTTGYEVQRENSAFWHSVSFGFEFEVAQLSRAVALPWFKRYAG